MTRYDWPAGPRRGDDQAGRAAHLVQLRPAADPEGALVRAPAPAQRGRSRAVAHNAPQVTQPFPWVPVGPSVTVNGQGTNNPKVAGRIRDLQVHEAGQRAYAASASGGVWYTDNGGATWAPLDEWQESPDRSAVAGIANALACGSIWVKWDTTNNPALDEVWVGTGELSGDAEFNPGGQIGGVGFLHATGPSTGGAWSIVKGGAAAADAQTLRGHEIVSIVNDTGAHDSLIAATSRGIYVLVPASGANPVTWAKVAANLPDNQVPVDIVVTRTGTKARVWVASWSALYVAEVTPPLTVASVSSFTKVALPEVMGGPPPAGLTQSVATKLAIAASPDQNTVYVLGRRYPRAGDVGPPTGSNTPAHLWTVTAGAAALHDVAATGVNGVPSALFGPTADQSHYDIAITAHPNPPAPGRIFIGGSWVKSGPANQYNGAVFRCEVGGATAVCTHVGDGVHADDHVIRVSRGPVAGKSSIWVGCDGGLFRSDNDGNAGTFSAINDGLAVLEPGYVASHPTNAGLIVAGFQDNGTAMRVGETVWRETNKGDGGGQIFHPSATARFVRQYVNSRWLGDGAFTAPVQRWGGLWSGGAARTSEDTEDDATNFYSTADAAEHGGETHLAVGTNRVWYSRDWGTTWVTVPTGTDPRPRPNLATPGVTPPDNTNLVQDVLDIARAPDPSTGSKDKRPIPDEYLRTDRFGVIALKFARPKQTGAGAAATARLRLLVLNRKELVWYTASQPVSPGPFVWDRPSAATPVARQVLRNTSTDFTSAGPVTFLPALDIVSDVAVHDVTKGELGSCYVSTIGRPQFLDASTRDAHIDTLWFFDGHQNWYPTGLRVSLPSGDWGTRTRVTAPALGVVVDPEHPEIVYVATAVGVVKGTLTIAGTAAAPTYSWVWEQFMNGLPEGAVQDLSIHWYPRPPVPDVDPAAGVAFNATAYAGTEAPVKLLRAAVQARGVWEVDLATAAQTERAYLRMYASDTRRRLPSPVAGKAVRGDQGATIAWDASPDIVIDTTGTVYATPPSEATLFALAVPPAATAPARYRVANRHPTVHVLVHYRWPVTALATEARVLLMRHDLPASGTVPLGGLWPALITASHLVAPPASLPGTWRAAGADLWKRPAAPLDVRTPQAVSFALDWTAERPNKPFVLLAVVMKDGPDNIGPADLTPPGTPTATTVAQLVASSAHCAAITVRVS